MREDDLPSPEDGGHSACGMGYGQREGGVTWRRGQHYRPPRRTFALCGKLAAEAKAACSRVCRMGQVGAEIGLDFGCCGGCKSRNGGVVEPEAMLPP